MTIKSILLSAAALYGLATAPAVSAPAPHIVAVAAHLGGVHVKTALPHKCHTGTCSSTIIASTTVSPEDYKKKTMLTDTFYALFDSGSFCNSSQKQFVRLAAKKTAYAKLSARNETLTGYCSTGPTIFSGDVYDLQTRKARGKTDTFRATLVGRHIHYNGGMFNIKIPVVVNVTIAP